MKRVLVALVTAGVLLLVRMTSVTASHADGASLNAFSVGGGSSTCAIKPCTASYLHFAFSAHCANPTASFIGIECTEVGTTDQPSGHAVFRFNPFLFTTSTSDDMLSGHVTCLSIVPFTKPPMVVPDGGIASITIQVDKANFAFGAPYATFGATDNDTTDTSLDVESISPPQPATSSTDCLTRQVNQQPVTQGQIENTLQSPLLGADLSGDWYQTDAAGNLYTLDNGTWTLLQ
jgi:hypothetical protein